MRELSEFKFRCWDTGHNKMLFSGEHLPTMLKFVEEGHPLMQYTGIKDKHGKDIYEGDIIKWQYDTELEKPAIKAVDVVVFRNGAFMPCAGPTHVEYYWVGDPECEVIGNIFENPELVPENKHYE